MSRLYFRAAIFLCCYLLTNTCLAQRVALTFDDLPAHGPLPDGQTRVGVIRDIIQALESRQAPAVYGFLNAKRLKPNDLAILETWRKAGFLLGNHTYSHMSLNENTVETYEADIRANETLLRSLMGSEDWQWFRYPFLWEGDTLEKRHAIRAYLKGKGYRVAQVTMDFDDYAWSPPYARCVAKKDQRSIEA